MDLMAILTMFLPCHLGTTVNTAHNSRKPTLLSLKRGTVLFPHCQNIVQVLWSINKKHSKLYMLFYQMYTPQSTFTYLYSRLSVRINALSHSSFIIFFFNFCTRCFSISICQGGLRVYTQSERQCFLRKTQFIFPLSSFCLHQSSLVLDVHSINTH